MSDEYLNKVRVGLRRSTLTTELEMELSDIIEQFRAYARWQFGIDGDNAERNHEEYIEMADNLRKGCR